LIPGGGMPCQAIGNFFSGVINEIHGNQ
jgi:hypothetical protein